MEAIVAPVTWDEWPEAAREVFQAIRSPAGEAMVLDKNVFVERILPRLDPARRSTDAEMAEYRRPFAEPGEGRRPTLTWPRADPDRGRAGRRDGDRRRLRGVAGDEPVPKLFVVADPGAILNGPPLEFCRTWPNQREVTVAGNHFVQEDSPDEIGRAIAAWMRERGVARE